MTVLGAKGWNLISGSTPAAVGRHAGLLREWFLMLEVARTPVVRGPHDFGAVAHVPIALANLGTIDRAKSCCSTSKAFPIARSRGRTAPGCCP